MESIIFDMDGTLFQTEKILEIALTDTFKMLCSLGEWEGIAPIDTYRKIMGVPLPRVWETLLPTHSEEIRKFTDTYFLQNLLEHIKEGEGALYPDVMEVLAYLKSEGFQLFIASNGLKEYLHTIVQHFGLDEFITETYSIEQITTLNKGDLVRSIIDDHNLKHGAVVGDRLSDILAANDNGFLSIGCRFDFSVENELEQADYVIDNILELKAMVETIKGCQR